MKTQTARCIAIFAAVLLPGLLLAQTVPSFSGETLAQKTITIPEETNGKYTFLCFASSMKAQKELETWLDAVYNHFIAKTGMMDEFYDVNVFFIPVFKGQNASMRETVRKKFGETAQDDIRGNVLFCKSDLAEVTTALNLQDNTPSFFLLDKQGKIIYRTTGAYTEKKFDEIDEKIEM
jgi:hypothetical protein